MAGRWLADVWEVAGRWLGKERRLFWGRASGIAEGSMVSGRGGKLGGKEGLGGSKAQGLSLRDGVHAGQQGGEVQPAGGCRPQASLPLCLGFPAPSAALPATTHPGAPPHPTPHHTTHHTPHHSTAPHCPPTHPLIHIKTVQHNASHIKHIPAPTHLQRVGHEVADGSRVDTHQPKGCVGRVEHGAQQVEGCAYLQRLAHWHHSLKRGGREGGAMAGGQGGGRRWRGRGGGWGGVQRKPGGGTPGASEEEQVGRKK